jgi:AcrR family transcriptional regulator
MTKTRNTRSLIRKAAAREFAEHGFAGARVARISKAAGVNKQLIFYYFGSKAGLYEAIVRSAEEGLTHTSGLQKDDAGQFRTSFHNIFHSLAAADDMTRFVFLGQRSGGSEQDSGRKQMVELLSNCVSRGQGLGHYRDDVNPELVARQAVLLLVGFFSMEDAIFLPHGGSRNEWLQATSAMLTGWLSW